MYVNAELKETDMIYLHQILFFLLNKVWASERVSVNHFEVCILTQGQGLKRCYWKYLPKTSLFNFLHHAHFWHEIQFKRTGFNHDKVILT